MEDSAIIELYNSRSESAIRETDKKYGKYCHTISFNILGNKQDVDECVNDTWLKTWNSIPPARPKSLKAYVGRIVRNVSLDLAAKKNTLKRGKGRYREVYDELEETLSSAAGADVTDRMALQEILNSFLASLTPDHRDVFVGRYWYFDSVAAISAKTGFSKSKVKMILMKCRNELREYLKKEGYDI